MITSIRILEASLNYCHIIHDDQHAIVIDPGESPPVLDWLKKQNHKLTHIFITHHHNDHIGGVNDLKSQFPSALIVASSTSPIEYDIGLDHSKTLWVRWLNESITCLDIPGHTMDHCLYLYQNAAFVGDTLFSLGCGKNFEGSFENLLNSLNLIKSLNDHTLIYFAHEYTKNNLAFTLSMIEEPTLQAYMQNMPSKTVPTTLAFEKKYNLFLNCDQPNIWKKLHHKLGPIHNDIECFTKLRMAKNSF
jgi:hydroxyacylglutathione hydrolase